MTRATTARLEWLWNSVSRRVLSGRVPRRWQDAIAAIETEISHANRKD